MLSPAGGIVLDPPAGLLKAALVCLETGWILIFIEWNETSFQHNLDIVHIHAVHEATAMYLMSYSTTIPTFPIGNPFRTLHTDSKGQPALKHCKLMDQENAIDAGRTDDSDDTSGTDSLFTLS